MKKSILFLAAAASLVACSKNEVTPVSSAEDVEISYLVAPKTKATTKFDQNWKFLSTAFYIKNADGTWASHGTTTPSTYIDSVEISYNTSDAVWRNASKKYYWPKDGKLTFFAWTNVTESIATDGTSTYTQPKKTGSEDIEYLSGVTVSNSEGVVAKDYDVVANKNVDFLVADIKADRKSNDKTPKYYTEGVPTLFKHKLSKVIFTAQTVKSGTYDAYDYKTTDKIVFKIDSIKFIGIDQKNTYTQGVTVAADSTSVGSWGTSPTEGSQTYTKKETEVTSTLAYLYDGSDENQYYYLPQGFDAQTKGSETKDYFEVNYTITYNSGLATEKTEKLTQKCILNNSESGKSIFPAWEMGKIYTINLKFSLNEILWDPAVQDWETANRDVTVGE